MNVLWEGSIQTGFEAVNGVTVACTVDMQAVH